MPTRALFVCFTALMTLSCDDPSGAFEPRIGAVDEFADVPGVPAHDEEHEGEPEDPAYWSSAPSEPLASYECSESKDTGYVQGSPFEITVVKVDGKPVEIQTANAFLLMRSAAAKDGVNIKVVSGFRTMAEQEYFYGCYVDCNCNNCNLAAKPGYSNHQSGHAIDINTGAPGVYAWMATHGASYGWEETVPSEDWHWEWWGGGPAASGPCGQFDFKATYVAQSFPTSSMPALVIKSGESFDAWIDLKNEGKVTWTGNTWLAPTPRDVASPLYEVGWASPIRITAPDADTPTGATGRFSFSIAGGEPGEYFQTFGLVEEGVSWFSDLPKGGGPPDTQLEIRVMVLEPDPLPPDSTSSSEPGTSSGESGTGSGGSGTTDDEVDELGGETGTGTGTGETSTGETSTGTTTTTTTTTTATPTTGEATDDSTGLEGQESGDMSEGASNAGGALPDGYGGDEGCDCRSDDRPGRRDLGLSGLALGLLLWTRRRRAGA